IPKVTDKAVLARVGDRNFELGQDYLDDGAVRSPRRQGATLKARCQGSSPEAYRVWVRFDARGIADGDCSCPVGSGGHCKHTAAVLLAWIQQPNRFSVVEEVDTALQRRSKEELIELVKQMLEQHPDLDVLLEAALPVDAPGDELAAYRRRADAL